LVQGECALAQGELFVVFELWFGGLRSLLDHGFVSDVSSRCPCLRGPRLVSSSDLVLCLSLDFDRLLKFLFIRFFCFPFLFGYQILCVVNSLIKGEIEDYLWFEDRWMVAS
jgi:hypothetical protein